MRLGDKTKIAIVLAFAALPIAASAQDQAVAPQTDMQQLLQDCDAHKFVTTIHVTGDDGNPHDSDVKVCGKKGQNDADWVAALKDILDKTAANQEMPQAVKDQVITALNAEIIRLSVLLPKAAPAVAGLPPPRAATPKDDLSGEYSSLPPLPPPIAETRPAESAPVAINRDTVTQPTAPGIPVVAAPPPPLQPGPVIAAAPAIPVVPAPRLTVRCMAGRDIGLAEPCYEIERGDMLVIEADQPTNSPVLLKFLRRGEPRGELRLPQMRASQPVTVALPAGICAGVAHTRIEIRASGSPGSEEAAFVPYDLRC